MTARATSLFVAATLVLAACGPDQATPAPGTPQYLYAWTASADSTQPDFLAVINITPDTGRYGSLVTTVPTPGRRHLPHHTEHEMPDDGQLFANGFASGQTWIFDLSDPLHPAIATQFGDVDGYSHPHSYLRLPSGNVLATFQMRHTDGEVAPGGLVELTPGGKAVRSASAVGTDVPAGLRPYSAAIVPALDRIVTTTTDMDEANPYLADQVQVWRLSTLELLHTITLPPGPDGEENHFTAEPRLLSDGRTVLVSTFNCGIYLLDGLEGDDPAGRMVASFPRTEGAYCAIPVIAGNFYLVTVPIWNAVVSLDISDPAAPREVSRLALGPGDIPHWIAISPDQRRVAITGYGAMANRVMMAQFDPTTGSLAVDPRFRGPTNTLPGFTLAGIEWPHGGSAAGQPHGVVFGRP